MAQKARLQIRNRRIFGGDGGIQLPQLQTRSVVFPHILQPHWGAFAVGWAAWSGRIDVSGDVPDSRPSFEECALPVCGGNAALPMGRGVRCAGFTLDFVVYCTREEQAGPLRLELSTEPPSYKHLLFGHCSCGKNHGLHLVRPERTQEAEGGPVLPLGTRHEILRRSTRFAFRAARKPSTTSSGVVCSPTTSKP